MTYEKLDESNFDNFISKGNAIIDFYADWCGPCKVIAPAFEKPSKGIKAVSFGKVDIDKTPDLAQRFSVMSIPTTIFFKHQEPIDTLAGSLT